MSQRLNLYAQAAVFAFGPRWQSEAARYHGVAVRTVQRWLAGEQEVPAGVFEEMATLLSQRMAEIETHLIAMVEHLPTLDGPKPQPG